MDRAKGVRAGVSAGWAIAGAKVWPRSLRVFAVMGSLFLGGCARNGGLVLLNPHGPIAAAELRFTTIDVAIMLGIIVPTAILVGWFIWRYRVGRGAKYDPKWSHSYRVEAVVWSIPIAVVLVLSYFSYQGTFDVNPYNPRILQRPVIKKGKGADKRGAPVNVDVITTDWQWLFIYPRSHIASVDKLVIPVNAPIRLRLTSATVNNAFMIPQLVGQIEIMPGMRTKQAFLAGRLGQYQGFSAEMSGPGFAWMRFHADVVSRSAFERWERKVASSPDHMTYAGFNRFAKPTFDVGIKGRYFSQVQDGLFRYVISEIQKGRVFRTPIGMGESMVADKGAVQ